MSTRAIIAYVSTPGRWKGVWNHSSSHPQYLGKALIDRVAVLDGDLDRMISQFIDRRQEGWSSFQAGERSEDPVGYLEGSITADAKVSVDDGLGLDTHFVYLFNRSDRSLSRP